MKQRYQTFPNRATCGGYGRFASFQTGQQITITDEAGRPVGTGQLGACQWIVVGGCIGCFDGPDYELSDAIFSFTLKLMPADSYSLRVDWQEWPPMSADAVKRPIELTVG